MYASGYITQLRREASKYSTFDAIEHSNTPLMTEYSEALLSDYGKLQEVAEGADQLRMYEQVSRLLML